MKKFFSRDLTWIHEPMTLTKSTSIFRTAKPVLILLAVASLACVAQAAPLTFDEDFTGPGLDPAWMQVGNLASHPAVIAGTYDMTHVQGDPAGGTKLRRSTTGTLSSYTHEIGVVLDPFGTPNTQSDFKWKSFGADGFMEIVLNSFGDMRLFQTGGSLVDNTPIGYADGDLLNLTVSYDQGADTMDVTYALNGNPAVLFYTGTGNGGSLGDVITSSVEVEVFKFGSDPDQPVVAIDSWSLVPEPTSAALLGIASLFLLHYGSRCRREARRSRA